MILQRLYSRRRFVVVRKSKKPQAPIEFYRKVDALAYAFKLAKTGAKPECFEVVLTWLEFFRRLFSLRRTKT